MFPEYSRVALITDKYANEGGTRGMIGYIIEIHEDGCYEVEFSDPVTGVTLVQLVVYEQDVALAPENGTS